MKRYVGFAAIIVLGACVSSEDGFSSSQTNAATSQRYIVQFHDHAAGMAALRGAGGSVALELPDRAAAAAYLPPAAVAALSSNPHVALVEPDPERMMLSQSVPYGIDMVQATDPAFTASPTAAKRVCIIDSGFYRGHEDLPTSNVTGDSDSGTGNWYQDSCGHGSHVAGTITALNNGVGVVGVAPQSVNLHIVKVFGDDCSWTYSSSLVAALDKCRAAGADVVSMSLGGGRKSVFEESAFNQAWSEGIVSVAAAGNDGTTNKSYPASYASVISVAAVDSSSAVASFSQQNDAVDVAAPGVAVLSTVPWNSVNTLSAGGNTWSGTHMDGAADATATGALVDGGLCGAAGSWSGKVVLCERGTYAFADKVTAVKAGGGVAAVIYNNVSGGFSGTLNGTATIPAIGLSREDGLAARAYLGQSSTVDSHTTKPASGYEAWDGTSMATPHVSAVAALIWSYVPGATNADVRAAIESSARDLGAAGRDNATGYGLVQARAALDALGGAGGCTPTAEVCDDGVDNDCDGFVDAGDADCGICLPNGASCSSSFECCSGRCGGKKSARTCR